MADGKRTYSIVINGLTESIDAVKSLNEQLNGLEAKIKAIESSTINVKANVSSTSASGGGSRTASLSEEEAIQREINKLKKEGETLDAKIAATQDEIYKKVDATKQLYKETVADQKAMAAEERLIADNYSNTMQGMKSHLADLKAAINVTDLGDSEKIGQMTKEANELTNKLKEMEEAYGQFGRNVGNYAEGVAEGLSKVKINVGGTVREFDNAKQAAKELGNELKTMAVNGQQGTKEFKDLQKAVAALNSDIKDATVSSKAMDNLLDTMQSIASIGSITKGFSALFGFDDTEIEKSIQKLVALQNVMQGIEKLNQQMNSGEGIGGWLSKGNAAVDALAEKLTGANKAQQALNASTTAGKTASEGLAAAETAQATATAGATVATKALSLALKAIGIGLVISAVATLITYWKDIYKWLTDTVPVLKSLEKWFDKIRAVAVGVGSAIANYMLQPFATLGKAIKALIEGNFSEIPKIITEGFKKTFNIAANFQKGYNKETERQQREHDNKLKAEQKKTNEELLKDEEAKYGTSHKRTQEYLKKQMALTEKGSDEYKELQRKLWEDERKEKEEANKKSLAAAKKANKEESEAEKDLVNLKIANMKEGLNKVLKQLEEERKQKLAKVEADGKLIAERQKEINEYYDNKILEEKKKWADETYKVYQELWDKLNAFYYENAQRSANLTSQTTELARQEFEKTRGAKMPKDSSSYGIQGRNQLSVGTQIELQLDEQNNKKLTETYNARLKVIEEYWDKRIGFEEKAAKNNYNAQIALEEAHFDKEKEDVQKQSEDIAATYRKLYDEEKITYEQYHSAMAENIKNFDDRWNEIEVEHTNNLQQIANDRVKTLQNVNAEYYRESLQELRDFQTAIASLESKQPVYNSWGIINLSETKKNNENLLESYRTLANRIVGLKRNLQAQLDANQITFDEFQQANRELDSFAENVGQKMDKVKYELSIGAQIGSFIQSIEQYVQTGLQAIQTVMNSLDEYEDYKSEKEQKMLEDENDMLQKMLDEQADIIEQHKSKVDSIEDELANSRGDRRQHLIDQLNAEMAAQRAAQKEEQRIQKEKEANEKRQDDLDKKRKQEEYERNLRSILISTAMATANGLATQPFVPVGIAMGSLATSLGMIQYALAKKQKPYRVGGQLEGGLVKGKRHTQGGVPVGNTGIEVEGDEMIIRRESTIPNIDLLNFINKSQRKVDINDLIEFYSSGKIKKNIQTMSPKSKYADGGYLPPLLSNNIELDDRLLDSFERYSNRPVVVSVVDITNKQDDVRRVQTLAGL